MLYAAEIGDSITSLILAIELVAPAARFPFRSPTHLNLAIDACHSAMPLSTRLKCSDAAGPFPDDPMSNYMDEYDTCGEWLVVNHSKLFGCDEPLYFFHVIRVWLCQRRWEANSRLESLPMMTKTLVYGSAGPTKPLRISHLRSLVLLQYFLRSARAILVHVPRYLLYVYIITLN